MTQQLIFDIPKKTDNYGFKKSNSKKRNKI